VPLLRRAYELWHELETDAGEQLLITTGSLEGGPDDGTTFIGAFEAARQHDIPHEVLDADELRLRYPAYAGFDDATRVVYQPDGAFLLAEPTMRAHHDGARRRGADLRFGEVVRSWEPAGDGVRVVTEAGTFEAERLVVCAGAWARTLVPSLERLAVPERQVLAWLTPKRPELFEVDRFPVFLIDVEEGSFPDADLRDAQSAFLASTTREIQPIAAIDGEALPDVGGGHAEAAAAALREAIGREHAEAEA